MTESKADQKFEQVVQRIDPQSKLLRTWAMTGGISAQVTVLEIEQLDGQTKKLIVRQHGDRDRKHNPHIANQPLLLHGDFWPGNLLWRDGRLVAIIDWEDAQVGDPLADVANSRLEILWAFGTEAMVRFANYYQSIQSTTTIDFTNLPCWDLWAALRPASKLSAWGLDDVTEKRMRAEHKWFVTQAFKKLGNSL